MPKAKTQEAPDLSNSGMSLLSCIERIESLEEEKAEISERISDEKKAIKSMGFDMKVVTKILQRRRMNPNERAELDSLIETYESALERAADARRISG